MKLEELLHNYLFRRVKIVLSSGAKFEGYLIGIKLPINTTVMLYFVDVKHGEKYIKNYNKKWVDQLRTAAARLHRVVLCDCQYELQHQL